MTRRIVPLIVCGGAGTRLWPASRENRPKQFLSLFGGRSTFQETLTRVDDNALFDRPIVITNATYRFMVREQLDEIGRTADILLEPCRRDSGPAIAAGAGFFPGRGPPPGGGGGARPPLGAAIRRRWCWRLPPIMWWAMRRPLSRLAVRLSKWRHPERS